MSFVKFVKVNHAINLPENITNGTIYLVKDVNKIYADFDNVRHSFSISPNDISGYVQDSLEDSLTDFKNSLDAIEATLDEDVENNYAELKANLRTIDQYSTTAEVEEMLDEAVNEVSCNFGTVDDGTIKLDKNHFNYKVNTTENSNIAVDVSKISVTDNIIKFCLIVENGDINIPNFTFNPITLDTSSTFEYNHKYIILKFTGIRKPGEITWLLRYEGGWN